MEMSIFSAVQVAPPDPILGVDVACKADTNPNKVNLGIGAYRTEEGLPYVFPVVRKIDKELADDPSVTKEYLPIDGLAALKPLTQTLAFGADSSAVREGRIASMQCISGTGGLRVVADFIKLCLPECKVVYISKPSWGNHKNIFGGAVGLEIREYPYWDQASKGVDFDNLIETLADAPTKSVVILHACAHNPTGVDLTEAQWGEVVDVCVRRELLPVIDSAYQGFASGDVARDAVGLRMFANKSSHPFFLTQSFAKNMGLYGERVGMLHAVCRDGAEAEAVLSQLKIVARRMYSSPPMHGALIVERLLGNEVYCKEWQQDLKGVAGRIQRMRQLLREGLERKQTPGTWGHITQQIGMFSFTGLSPEQCKMITTKWHVYLLSNGRISMAGINKHNIDYLVNAIDDVVRSVP